MPAKKVSPSFEGFLFHPLEHKEALAIAVSEANKKSVRIIRKDEVRAQKYLQLMRGYCVIDDLFLSKVLPKMDTYHQEIKEKEDRFSDVDDFFTYCQEHDPSKTRFEWHAYVMPPEMAPELITLTQAISLAASGIVLQEDALLLAMMECMSASGSDDKLFYGSNPVAEFWIRQSCSEEEQSAQIETAKTNGALFVNSYDAQRHLIDCAKAGKIEMYGYILEERKWNKIPQEYFFNPLEFHFINNDLCLDMLSGGMSYGGPLVSVENLAVLRAIRTAALKRKIVGCWKEVRVVKRHIMDLWPGGLINSETYVPSTRKITAESRKLKRNRPQADRLKEVLRDMYKGKPIPKGTSQQLMNTLRRNEELSPCPHKDTVLKTLRELQEERQTNQDA